MNLVAMIGYIQKRSAGDWHSDINKWISELANGAVKDSCIWNAGEILKPLDEIVSKGCPGFYPFMAGLAVSQVIR